MPDTTWPLPSWPMTAPKDADDELDGPPYLIPPTERFRITVHIREVRGGVMLGDDDEPT